MVIFSSFIILNLLCHCYHLLNRGRSRMYYSVSLYEPVFEMDAQLFTENDAFPFVEKLETV